MNERDKLIVNLCGSLSVCLHAFDTDQILQLDFDP